MSGLQTLKPSSSGLGACLLELAGEIGAGGIGDGEVGAGVADVGAGGFAYTGGVAEKIAVNCPSSFSIDLS